MTVSRDTETLLMTFSNRDVSEVVTSAGSLMVCLRRRLRWNRESSCCCCPSVSEQVELMHYLKSLPLTLPASPQSHKRPKVTGTMETRRSSIPLPTPITPSNAHTQANKLPLTYHRRRPHTGVHTFRGSEHTDAHALVFCSQPSLNSFPCILQLACHSSPPSAISLSLPDLIMAPPG